MNYFPLSESQLEWQERVRDLAGKEVGPRADGYDRKGQFPQESLNALRDAGLWALRVSQEYGGQGADLLTTCLVVEEISKKCPSTAMCYKMHLEASEILNLIPTPYQIAHFIKPLAEGKVFATIAGGESGGTTGNDQHGPFRYGSRVLISPCAEADCSGDVARKPRRANPKHSERKAPGDPCNGL